MKPATKRLLSVLVSFALLVGAMIAFSSLVAPAYRDIQQLRGEKKSLEAVIAEEEQLVVTAGRLLNESRNAADLRDSLSLVLPREEAIPGVVNQVQGIAKATGVVVEGIDIETLPLDYSPTSSIVEPVGSFKVTVRLSGGYEAIKSYIQSLETNVRIIDVDSMAVSGGGVKTPLKVDLGVRTYYQK